MESQDLKELQKNLKSATSFMSSQVKHEDAVIFFGYTKSGKSSLLNFLIGNSLTGQRLNDCMPITINKVGEERGPEIGLEPSSKTIIPTRWENKEKLSGLGLWDLPGYDDNRGSVQDITGAYYIYEIFDNVKSMKMVLVVDINDIVSSRVNSFIDLLHSVERLLNGKMNKCFSSIIIIFTKVPNLSDDRPVDKKFICEIMKYQILSYTDTKISDTVKQYVQFLVDNNQNIGLFKKAKIGPITSEFEVDIFKSIKDADSVKEDILKFTKPTLSDKSKVFIFTVREELYCKEDFNRFQQVVNDLFDNEFQNYNAIISSDVPKDKLQSTKEPLMVKVNELKKIIDINSPFDKKINIFLRIIPNIKNRVDIKNLIRLSKLMKFLDVLLDLKEKEYFDVNLQRIIGSVISKIDGIIANIDWKLSEIHCKEIHAILEENKLKKQQAREERKLKEKQMEQMLNKMRIKHEQELAKAREPTVIYIEKDRKKTSNPIKKVGRKLGF